MPAGNPFFILIASHDGSRNFIVTALDESLERLDGAVNEIGPYLGTTLVNERGSAADVRYFEVQADGNWTLELVGIDRVPSAIDPAFSGEGAQVIVYNGDGGIFDVTHVGERNFAVWFYSASATDLIVNEIGNYTGRKALPPGTALLEIAADGAWTFTES